jgi:hypothetical protein
MGIVLPDALAWVLNLIGIDWPNIDEDQLRSGASDLKQIASELTSNKGDAESQIEQMLGVNSSQALKNFEAIWDKVAKDHLPQLAQGMDLLADGLDVSAVVVTGMKVAAIAQLAILAAEIIADQAAAPFTFGASEAAIPAEEEITEQVLKRVFDQAVKSVEQQLINAVEGPIFDALDSAAENMAGQLLGDALGTHSGVDLGAVGQAAGSGFGEGVQTAVTTVTTPWSPDAASSDGGDDEGEEEGEGGGGGGEGE